MINQIIEDMKERLPNSSRTKPYFDKLIADGFTEEQAKDIMIYTWLNGGALKLTENKRFTIAIDSNNRKSLWDENRTEEEPLICLDKFDEILGIDECCDLLNEQYYWIKTLELQEENRKQYQRQLEKENKKLKDYAKELEGYLTRIEEKTIQLEKALKSE